MRLLFHHPQLLGAALLLAGTACQRGPATASGPDCLDPAKKNSTGMCPILYDPVCGCDGKTYSNACVAGNAGVRSFTKGPCPGK